MTTYDKAKIMRLAHHMRKHEGFTMSVALKLAWIKAKKSEFYLIIKITKPCNVDTDYSNPMIQESLTNYYANNRYNGD